MSDENEEVDFPEESPGRRKGSGKSAADRTAEALLTKFMLTLTNKGVVHQPIKDQHRVSLGPSNRTPLTSIANEMEIAVHKSDLGAQRTAYLSGLKALAVQHAKSSTHKIKITRGHTGPGQYHADISLVRRR
jgi:hypothetical protein